MLFAICEQHVIAVDHRGEEMAFLAGLPLPVLALFGLNHPQSQRSCRLS